MKNHITVTDNKPWRPCNMVLDGRDMYEVHLCTGRTKSALVLLCEQAKEVANLAITKAKLDSLD